MSEDPIIEQLSIGGFEMLVSFETSKHFECIKDGGIVTIDYDGIWCTKDDPKPEQKQSFDEQMIQLEKEQYLHDREGMQK